MARRSTVCVLMWLNFAVMFSYNLKNVFNVIFQDLHSDEFEDKDWTFVLENVSEALSQRNISITVMLDCERNLTVE